MDSLMDVDQQDTLNSERWLGKPNLTSQSFYSTVYIYKPVVLFNPML